MFLASVKAVILALDPVLGSYVRHADIFASDIPGIELVADGVDPRALLLFDGLNLPDHPGVPCARIFVYQRNLERLAGNQEMLEDEVKAALEREIAMTFLEEGAGQRSHKELN